MKSSGFYVDPRELLSEKNEDITGNKYKGKNRIFQYVG